MSLKSYLEMHRLAFTLGSKIKKQVLEIYDGDSLLKTNPGSCYCIVAQHIIRSSNKWDMNRMSCDIMTVQNERGYMGVKKSNGTHSVMLITIIDNAYTPTGEREDGGSYVLEPQTMRFMDRYKYNNKIVRMFL